MARDKFTAHICYACHLVRGCPRCCAVCHGCNMRNDCREKLHPHAFRHFFSKMYLKKTKDVIGLADILGHGSVDTTRLYLKKSQDEQKRLYNRTVTW